MPEQSQALRPVPPLPATKSDLAAHLTYKRGRTIIDDVQEIMQTLWEDPNFTKYLLAIEDEQAVEGSCDADDYEAARMIRDKGHELGMEPIANAKLSVIRKALRRVLGGRYEGVSRKDRREATVVAPATDAA